LTIALAGVDWLEQVDWEHWRASARDLGADHPTVARDYGPVPVKTRVADPAPDLSPSRGERGKAEPETFKSIRQTHGPLLDRVAATARVRGLAIRTEQTYLHWIMRFIGFLGNRDPTDRGAEDAAAFLEHLALERKVSASTQNLALNSLVFLYREVLKRADLDLGEFARAKRPRRLPTVLTHGEVTALLGQLEGTHRLMAA
jgi:integrase